MALRPLAVFIVLVATSPALALQVCTDAVYDCTCPYASLGRTCGEASFPCDAPTDCDEVRGCDGYCTGSSGGVPWTPPGCAADCALPSPACSACTGLPFNPCCVENGSSDCEGACVTVPPAPVTGEPDRDPFHYGLLATEQLKLEDIVVRHESPNPSAPVPPPGPACHVGTNCNTTSENGPVGVMIVNQAVFPKGTQVVVGKPKWRSKLGQRPALADQIFANDWVEPGGDKVCNPSDGRQLWCFPPLLRNRYWGRCNPGNTTNACPAGDNFCFCDEPCYFEAQWDETMGADQNPGTNDFGSSTYAELWAAAACNIPNQIGGDPCQLGHPSCRIISAQNAAPIAPGAYWRIQVNDGINATIQPNGAFPFFAVCNFRLNSNATLKIHEPSVPPNTLPAVTMFGRDFSMANNSKFLWTDPGVFKWVNGVQASPSAIFPSSVTVGIFGTPSSSPSAHFSLGTNVFLNGTFVAPQVDMALGTNSTLRGRFLGKTLIGQPKDFYCGCRGTGAGCTQASDCCSYACNAGVCS